MGFASRNVQKTRELTPQEAAFVEAYSTPPYTSIINAGKLAGYSPSYSYKLYALPHIRAAIDERSAELRRIADATFTRLMVKWGDGAIEGDQGDAKLFLQAMNIGQGGVRIVNNVTANASQTDALEDRIKRIVEVPENS